MAELTAPRKVVLVSAEGEEITLTEEEACCSKLIQKMLENETFVEGKSRRIQLPLVMNDVLQVIVRYFQYKLKYQDSAEKVPEFQIEPKLLIDVLKAANYLDC